jgi:hypothetical protein
MKRLAALTVIVLGSGARHGGSYDRDRRWWTSRAIRDKANTANDQRHGHHVCAGLCRRKVARALVTTGCSS